jgi:hypothetical protein
LIAKGREDSNEFRRVDRELNNRLGIRVWMPDVFDVSADDDVPETMTDPSHVKDFVMVRSLRRQLVMMT